MRKQLYDLKDVLKIDSDTQDKFKVIDEFDKKLKSIEDELFQPIIAEGDSKSFRYPHKLYCKLSVLAGDLNDSVDFAPNKQQKEVYEMLKNEVEKQKKRFEGMLKKDLPEFNHFLDYAAVFIHSSFIDFFARLRLGPFFQYKHG